MPQVKNHDIADFIIKPAQRIVKYPLLLNDLIKHTDPSHEDYKDLVLSEEVMRKVLNDINSSTRMRQTVIVLSKLIPNLAWKTDSMAIDLMASKVHLLLSEKTKLTVRNTQTNEQQKGNYIYLFDTLLLVCNKSLGKWQELTHFMLVDSVVNENMQQPPSEYAFTVTHKSRPEEIIFCPNEPQQKQLYISLISDAIKDAPTEAKTLVYKIKKDLDPEEEKKFKRVSSEGHTNQQQTISLTTTINTQQQPSHTTASPTNSSTPSPSLEGIDSPPPTLARPTTTKQKKSNWLTRTLRGAKEDEQDDSPSSTQTNLSD